MQRADVRIIAGSLKGRKLTAQVHPGLRPTPDMVRGALFSILGNAVPGRAFFDLFAGTGVVGLEALSRGAAAATFVERDFKLADAIERHLREFKVAELGRVVRTDVYRWADRWQPGPEPVTAFLSPPFPDLHERLDGFLNLVAVAMSAVPDGSVVVVQAESDFDPAGLADAGRWDVRGYGRNQLLFWVKEPPEATEAVSPAGG